MSNLSHGTGHPSRYSPPAPEPGAGPLYNGDGLGGSYTPTLDEMYSPLTDDSVIADIGDYDPSLQSVPADTDAEGDDANG